MAAAPIFLVHLARKPRCANAWEDAIDCSYRFILNWPIALEAVEDDHRPVFSDQKSQVRIRFNFVSEERNCIAGSSCEITPFTGFPMIVAMLLQESPCCHAQLSRLSEV